ncbi:hypothetical protein F0U44_18475 [Nocardioides humilatus]|uniref:Uncharacterized protein n=1 Tax=Nocardioides humilatus TaxID=2607660 RepID=A0A5B1L759_9ACTN|nr:hypothetical protein [Nocardioides humilatus]KAA1416314.1 hypothetical protein F0U44_18475 [Nocardioides humilatus]
MANSGSRIRAVGAVRAAVGIALLAAPKAISRNDDADFTLLMRTIGVRDLVLGTGALLGGAEPGGRLWAKAAMASDSIDVVVGTLSIPKVGLGGGLVAALLPIPFVAADRWSLSG